MCHCRIEVPLVTSWTRGNPGREFLDADVDNLPLILTQYFGVLFVLWCGVHSVLLKKFQVYGKRCYSYFKWYDEDGYARDNKVIVVPSRNIEEMK